MRSAQHVGEKDLYPAMLQAESVVSDDVRKLMKHRPELQGEQSWMEPAAAAAGGRSLTGSFAFAKAAGGGGGGERG